MLAQNLHWAGFVLMAKSIAATQRAKRRHRLAFHWHRRRDLQHLVAVVGQAVHENHENRGAGQPGEGYDAGQEPGLPPEEGHFDSAGPVSV